MAMDRNKNKPATKAVHGRGRPKMEVQPVNPPIIQSTNFLYESIGQYKRYLEGDKSVFIYSRYDNPTIMEVEGHVADLENADRALIFSSGMGAISSTIMALVKSGDTILAGDTLYGGTVYFFRDVLPRFGVETIYFDSRNFDGAEKYADSRCRILYIETPANPNLRLTDLKAAVKFAKANGLFTIIDNTFATPINQNPLDYGFDLVIHSGSKYLSGSSDLVCGAVAGSDELAQKIWDYRRLLGTNLDPSASFLLLKGIKSLGVRVERHNQNAMAVAKYFENHPKIEKVHYPGLESHPQHLLAAGQMRGFGGMVNIELKGGQESSENFVDNLKVILNTVSLGGVESIACIPVLTSQYGLSDEALREAGITPSMVRLSIGIEDEDDLVADIEQALDTL
ncbi:MAG: aminotransferase class I/II-fold pyridoxal phosphate-dependent enzyme [candidate division Zixibacteria bacterium]|nr:aminotransferase class I/II-fold pyridoxal phosphate-dependent enzyme [candidate division Zixibacteria bacterium]